MIKCLIFDCDGTLVDSELLCNLGLVLQLKEYGVNLSSIDLMQKYRGGKLADILKSIEKEHSIVLKEDFEKNYRIRVDHLFERALTPCKGVIEFLAQNTLSVCVASSGPIKKINKALSITGLNSYFTDNIFSSYEINSWKPDPDIFLYAAKTMGFAPKECLVIEDSEKGIQAGVAAGMKTVLFDPDDLHSQPKGVDCINHMKKLQKIISTCNE